MGISNVDIMRMNQYLQGKVESFYDVIPESTKMDIQELFVVLIKMFRKGLQTGRKDLYLLNILVAMDSIIDELSESGEGLDIEQGEEARKLLAEYLEYAEKKGNTNDEIVRILKLFSNYVYIGDTIYDLRYNDKKEDKEEEVVEEEKSEEEQKEELYQKIASSFTSLNVENDDLRKEIESLKRKGRGLQKNLDSKTRQLASSEKEVSSLRHDNKDYVKKIDALNRQVARLNKVIEEQKGQIKTSALVASDVTRNLSELTKLRAELDAYRKKDKVSRNPKTNEQFNSAYFSAKKTILDMLMNGVCCFEDIENELKRQKKLLSRTELFGCLSDIQNEYPVNVIIGNGGKIYYRIESLGMTETKSISIPVSNSAYTDIMLTADWHQYAIDHDEERKIDSLYEYCIKNGIHMIWNLGDLFDYNYVPKSIISSNLAKESYTVYKRIEKLANNMPYDHSITHYILGGNHDEFLRRLRIEVLDFLASIRPDMYSLGYDHAFISLGSSIFGLHHPNKKLNTLREYRNYLEQYYNTNKLDINYNDVYMNFFGHFHMYKYFHQDGFMSIPSLTRDSKGAVHMRVYLNDKGHVEYVELIPLRYEHKVGLVKEKPMQYKKIKKR